MQADKKNLQSSRLQRIPKTSESILGYPVNTGASGMKVPIARMVSYPRGFTGGREL